MRWDWLLDVGDVGGIGCVGPGCMMGWYGVVDRRMRCDSMYITQ